MDITNDVIHRLSEAMAAERARCSSGGMWVDKLREEVLAYMLTRDPLLDEYSATDALQECLDGRSDVQAALEEMVFAFRLVREQNPAATLVERG